MVELGKPKSLGWARQQAFAKLRDQVSSAGKQLSNATARVDITRDAIKHYLQALDCPRSLGMWLLFEAGEISDHDQLTQLKCRVDDYPDQKGFSDAYLATRYLKKYVKLNTSFNKKEVALENFKAVEAGNRLTNKRWIRGQHSISDWNLIHKVARKISSILGRFDPEKLFDKADWGPGASLSVKMRDASSFKKFRDDSDVTLPLYHLIRDLHHVAYPTWKPLFCVVQGDRLTTAPKDSSVDRIILIQPGINLYYQKGMGSIIRDCLKGVGLDLDVGAVRTNHRLAKLGSITDEYATVDLKDASNTLCTEPLREVLEETWFQVLDVLRTKTSLDGQTRWEMFSAMGNGFTFELETLIFFALASVSVEETKVKGEVSVFGDDIVLPSLACPLLFRLLRLFGFNINESKTFVKGPFRESCGVHYYDGVSCKPVHQKDEICSVRDLFKAHNATRCSDSHGPNCGDPRFDAYLNRLRYLFPGINQVKTPWHFGDVGFASSFEQARPSLSNRKRGWQSFCFIGIGSKTNSFETDEKELLLVRLTESGDVDRRNTVDLKKATRGTMKWYETHDWPDPGVEPEFKAVVWTVPPILLLNRAGLVVYSSRRVIPTVAVDCSYSREEVHMLEASS